VPSRTDPNPPLVGGRYQLLAPVREGPLSEFWRAELHGAGGLRRLVGFKRLRAEHAQNPNLRELFIREARILALMDHPTVVQLFDFAEDHRNLYMVTEWVHGVSLAEIIWLCNAHRVLPSPVIVTAIGIEILRALEAAHTRMVRAPDGSLRPAPILQRDLSPENVLLSVRGHVKLMDFGVTRPLDPLALARMSPGSSRMSYIAPEVVAGSRPTPASDLYACAALLWETITGRRLWGEATGFNVLAQLLDRKRPPGLREARSDAPADVAEVLDRALSPDPAERFSTAGAMVRALSVSLRGIPEVTDASRLAAEVQHAVSLRHRWLMAHTSAATAPVENTDDDRPTLLIDPAESKPAPVTAKPSQPTRETLVPVEIAGTDERDSAIPVEIDLARSRADDSQNRLRQSSDEARDAQGQRELELDVEILGESQT
jgi:serine/threonine-protein kinase